MARVEVEQLSSAVGREVFGNGRIRPVGPWLYRDSRWDLGHHHIQSGIKSGVVGALLLSDIGGEGLGKSSTLFSSWVR